MPTVKIAHLREQGQDMIIVPLDSSFGYKSDQDKQGTIRQLEVAASRAQLRGKVVPVWNESGRMAFIAPRPWHPFFKELSLNAICGNLNRELHW